MNPRGTGCKNLELLMQDKGTSIEVVYPIDILRSHINKLTSMHSGPTPSTPHYLGTGDELTAGSTRVLAKIPQTVASAIL